MADDLGTRTDPSKAAMYEFQLEGHLDHDWEGWFGDAHITLKEDGTTLLACPVIDQAALFGLLKKVRDLGMPLISVARIGSGRSPESGVER